MTVVQPNSIAGINSITVQSGESLSIHKSDGSLIRELVSATGVSTFHAIDVSLGAGDLTVGISTLFVDNSAGKVAIGTAAPGESLEIGLSGDIKLQTGVSVATTKRINALGGTGSYSYNSSGGSAVAFIRDASNNDAIAFETHVQGSSHLERVRIASDGKVGINTTTPDELLHITHASAPAIQLQATSGGPYKSLIKTGGNDMEIRGSSGNMEFYTGNADGDSSTIALTINSSQNATFAGSVTDSKGNLRSIPRLDKTANYTAVAADAGKVITTNIGSSGEITINASVFSEGDALTIQNYGSAAITIVQGSGMAITNCADGATGNRTLASKGMATLYFLGGTGAAISGAGLS